MKSFKSLQHSLFGVRPLVLLFGLFVAVSAYSFNPQKFYISVSRMNPMGYPSKDVDYGYSLKLSNDSVHLYLPYMGRAFQLPYGGGDGLNFDEPIKGFKSRTLKKGGYRISFTTRHEMSTYQFYIELYPEANSAYISVVPSNCEAISYLGRLEDEKK
jgi:hypothetical protein